MTDMTLAEIVFVILMGMLAIVAIAVIYSNRPSTKWKNVINPTYEDENKNKEPLQQESKKNTAIKKSIDKIAKKKNWDKKISKLYMQAGKENKKFEDFVVANAKFVLFGVGLGLLTYLAFQNILISIIAFIVVAPLHFIDIFGAIGDRKKEFRNQFPFFLKTLSFVLENGSSLAIGFREVVNRTKPGVLKECMTRVLEIQKINGGDFISAFSIIPEMVKCDEAEEFVEAVQNSYEKGVPVAETFGSQSDYMSRFIENVKMKKVNNLDNKMMIPLLLIFGAVALLIWAGLQL